MDKNVLAFDFGASTGRAIVGKYYNNTLELDEIHRFSNDPIQDGDTLRWDFPFLMEQTLYAIKKATEKYEIHSISIDTWGVDFGLLNADGSLIESPVHYRDERTKGSLKEIEKLISKEDLYLTSGIEIMEINTLFQLWVQKERQKEVFDQAETMLLMPDLIAYMLCGKKKSERSIASTTQLLNPLTNEWNWELIDILGLPRKIFTEVVNEGSFLGELKEEYGLGPIPVYNVCEHDTQSAVVSVPSNDKFLFISCGTWSLVGTELDSPVLNKKAAEYNITNESGSNNTTTFLKNCTGLWMLQELRREFKKEGLNYDYKSLDQLAIDAEPFKVLLDTDDGLFLGSGQMKARMQDYAKNSNQSVLATDGELARTVYESLAFKYRKCITEISDVVGADFDTINIVGGGSQARVLCQMVADATGKKVVAGPAEATAIGNIVAQLIALKAIESVQAARTWIQKYFEVKVYMPQNTISWDAQYERYLKLVDKK